MRHALDKTVLNGLLQHRKHCSTDKWELVNDDTSTGPDRIGRRDDVDECSSRFDEGGIAALTAWAGCAERLRGC
jgi:hypothetical protein